MRRRSTRGRWPRSATSSSRPPCGRCAPPPSCTTRAASARSSASRRCCRSRWPNRPAAAASWRRSADRADREWRWRTRCDSAGAGPPSPDGVFRGRRAIDLVPRANRAALRIRPAAAAARRAAASRRRAACGSPSPTARRGRPTVVRSSALQRQVRRLQPIVVAGDAVAIQQRARLLGALRRGRRGNRGLPAHDAGRNRPHHAERGGNPRETGSARGHASVVWRHSPPAWIGASHEPRDRSSGIVDMRAGDIPRRHRPVPRLFHGFPPHGPRFVNTGLIGPRSARAVPAAGATLPRRSRTAAGGHSERPSISSGRSLASYRRADRSARNR